MIQEFGVKRENEERRDGGCAVVFDPATQKYAVGKQIDDGFLRLFSGGVDPDEGMEQGTLREVVEESGLYDFLLVEKIDDAIAHYHNSLKNVNRLAHVTCFLVILRSARLKETQLEEHEKFSLSWVSEKDIILCWEAYDKKGDVDHWLYFFKKAVQRLEELGYSAMQTYAKN